MCQRETSIYPTVPVLILYSQSLLHFFSNLVITPKPLPTHDIFEASKEIRMSKILAVWWMWKNCPSTSVIASCFLEIVCGHFE